MHLAVVGSNLLPRLAQTGRGFFCRQAAILKPFSHARVLNRPRQQEVLP
jgi:hypothetical protein